MASIACFSCGRAVYIDIECVELEPSEASATFHITHEEPHCEAFTTGLVDKNVIERCELGIELYDVRRKLAQKKKQ